MSIPHLARDEDATFVDARTGGGWQSDWMRLECGWAVAEDPTPDDAEPELDWIEPGHMGGHDARLRRVGLAIGAVAQEIRKHPEAVANLESGGRENDRAGVAALRGVPP